LPNPKLASSYGFELGFGLGDEKKKNYDIFFFDFFNGLDLISFFLIPHKINFGPLKNIV
jgi:hypothetical protein